MENGKEKRVGEWRKDKRRRRQPRGWKGAGKIFPLFRRKKSNWDCKRNCRGVRKGEAENGVAGVETTRSRQPKERAGAQTRPAPEPSRLAAGKAAPPHPRSRPQEDQVQGQGQRREFFENKNRVKHTHTTEASAFRGAVGACGCAAGRRCAKRSSSAGRLAGRGAACSAFPHNGRDGQQGAERVQPAGRRLGGPRAAALQRSAVQQASQRRPRGDLCRVAGSIRGGGAGRGNGTCRQGLHDGQPVARRSPRRRRGRRG